MHMQSAKIFSKKIAWESLVVGNFIKSGGQRRPSNLIMGILSADVTGQVAGVQSSQLNPAEVSGLCKAETAVEAGRIVAL